MILYLQSWKLSQALFYCQEPLFFMEHFPEEMPGTQMMCQSGKFLFPNHSGGAGLISQETQAAVAIPPWNQEWRILCF